MRLDRYLANAGVGTRLEVKKLIKKSFVFVNDAVIRQADYAVDLEKDVVRVDDTVIHYQEFVYVMLNKPAGYLSAKEDRNDKTVMELIEGYDHRDLHIVGRLDKDTTGLLLLTDDGQFTHHVTSPKHLMAKRYRVTVDKDFPVDQLKKLESSIMLDGSPTLPGEASLIEDRVILLTIYEGKHHQVKRMFERLGYDVVALHREAIGDLTLRDLKEGAFRELTQEEFLRFKNV
jgi:16S rRNA pseudouridine516 synthase